MTTVPGDGLARHVSIAFSASYTCQNITGIGTHATAKAMHRKALPTVGMQFISAGN